MAVIHLTTCVLLLAAGTVFSTSAQLETRESNDEGEVGNWTVGDCIMAKFSMEFTVSIVESSITPLWTPPIKN